MRLPPYMTQYKTQKSNVHKNERHEIKWLPLMIIAGDGVHGVISLYRLVDSWVRRSLTLSFLLIFLVLIIVISP
jgi:hypothetical protein